MNRISKEKRERILKMTPAQAAGLTDDPMTIAQLVEMQELAERRMNAF